jgi:hypothetical protein
MTFQEWLSFHNTNHSSSDSEEEMRYLQQGVVAEMGPLMVEEYKKFSLDAAHHFQHVGDWDSFNSNLLLCGAEGAITPVHFDEQENIFAQLSGVKRVRLFPPEAWARLYPYPLGHPSDRQAQVVLPAVPGSTRLDEEAHRALFPAFESADPATMELYVDMMPGECLFIPQYWWHQMEALSDNVSLAWWYKHQQHKPAHVAADKDDLSSINKQTVSLIAVRRNMERLIGDMVGGGQQAHRFFLSLAAGRVAIPTEEVGTDPTLGIVFTPRFHGAGDSITEGECSHPVLAHDVTAAAGVEVPSIWSAVAAQAVKFVSLVIEVSACAVSCRVVLCRLRSSLFTASFRLYPLIPLISPFLFSLRPASCLSDQLFVVPCPVSPGEREIFSLNWLLAGSVPLQNNTTSPFLKMHYLIISIKKSFIRLLHNLLASKAFSAYYVHRSVPLR